MRRNLVIIFLIAAFSVFSAYAQTDVKNLKKQIEDLQDQLDDLADRVDVNEQHTVMDKINFSYELRTNAYNMSYKDMRGLPDWASTMMGLWAFNRLAVPAGQIGGTPLGSGSGYTFNPSFVMANQALLQGMMPAMMQMGFIDANGFVDMNGNNQFDMYDMPMIGVGSLGTPYFTGTFGASDMAKYQMMFQGVQPKVYDYDNSLMYTTRLRIDMDSQINEHLKFGGRMTMYKVWGNGAESSFFNGQMTSQMMDGLDTSMPSDDKLRIERAFFTYSWDGGHFSVGRRPSTDGPPMEYRNYSVVGGSPISTLINWQFDGMSLGFSLENATGIPGASIKFCYGYGFESGYGNSYSYNSANADVNDTQFGGFIAHLYRTRKIDFVALYAHAFSMADGFTGTVVMPFVVQGSDVNRDGVFDEYYLAANNGGYISRTQATSNIGTEDMGTLLVRGEAGNFGYFASYSVSRTSPNGRSMNPMMQFWGKDALLNDNGGQENHNGSAVWAGLTYNWENGARLGAEYNHGSKYWFNFTGAEDNIVGAKAAARGDVYELYFTYPFYGTHFFLTGGYQKYDYEYTGSGMPLGAPKKIENATAFDALMPIVDKVDNIYLSLTARY